jgi:hypothetical protein
MNNDGFFFRSPQEATLADAIDRLLEKGVVIAGDLVLSVANIDLVYCELRLLLISMDKYEEMKKLKNG